MHVVKTVYEGLKVSGRASCRLLQIIRIFDAIMACSWIHKLPSSFCPSFRFIVQVTSTFSKEKRKVLDWYALFCQDAFYGFSVRLTPFHIGCKRVCETVLCKTAQHYQCHAQRDKEGFYLFSVHKGFFLHSAPNQCPFRGLDTTSNRSGQVSDLRSISNQGIGVGEILFRPCIVFRSFTKR